MIKSHIELLKKKIDGFFLFQSNGVVQNEVNSGSEKPEKNIIERLELQLLLAVIVFFVSGWAYLNKSICEFTGNEILSVQMSYILVHYILTATLFLCLYITFLKGLYIITAKQVDDKNIMFFKLFMISWYYVLLLCLVIIAWSSYVPWWISWLLFLIVIGYRLKASGFFSPDTQKKGLTIILWILCCFPIFISSMSLIDKNIDIVLDKEYYNVDDDIIITINSKGYACDWKIVCLGEKNLHSNANPVVDNNMIILKPCDIKGGNNHNRQITVGAISPASGPCNFIMYPIRKMLNKDVQYLDMKNPNAKKHIYYTTASVNIVL